MYQYQNLLQHKTNTKNLSQVWSLLTTSGLEPERDYSGRRW